MPTQTADETEVLRLDCAWNEAYQRQKRTPLAHILADDFTGEDASGVPFTKAMLLVDSPETPTMIAFSEQAVRVFGDTAISRGRLIVQLENRRIDQRFLRVFAKRGGVWQAVSVAVTPVQS
jgi:hypothetical protein